MSELLACCAPHCVSHFEMLDQLCSSFFGLHLQQASAQCLPHVKKTCVPDWNVSANKLKQSALPCSVHVSCNMQTCRDILHHKRCISDLLGPSDD